MQPRSTVDLIVSHDHADFDALAAQVAAGKLYPGAVLALPPSLGRDVRRYVALHRDRLAFVPLDEIDTSLVTRLILVDVRSASRLRHVAPLLARRDRGGARLEIRIYDHHAARDDDVVGDVEVIDKVGSATTLLTEGIRQRRVGLDEVEATLLALGIHTDTGSLTFPGTTPRDAGALAFLLESGAALEVQNRYLHTPFKLSQRQILTRLLQETEVRPLAGLRIGIASLALRPEQSSGLDEVTTRALDLLACHALFALFRVTPSKIQIVARARSGLIDVARVLRTFGGGGHASAGAAAVKKADLQATRARLLSELVASAPKARRARDIMSSPVHSVTTETTLDELGASLRLWGHTGACVTRNGQLVGVISRRDVQRAQRAGAGQRRVKSFMSPKLFTTAADASLEEVYATMESEDVGRLPVLDGGRLIGIVSRSDVLEAMYGSGATA